MKEKTHSQKPTHKYRVPDRIDKVITLLPHTKTKKEAMLKAGYSPTTAQGRHSALNKRVEERLLLYIKEDLPTDKYFNVENLLQEYEKICKQDKDMGTKYRAIRGVLDKYPDILAVDSNNQHEQPVFNIIVRELNVENVPKPTPINVSPIDENPV
jgi:hypothetical protein